MAQSTSYLYKMMVSPLLDMVHFQLYLHRSILFRPESAETKEEKYTHFHLLGIVLAKALTQGVTLPWSIKLPKYVLNHIDGMPLRINNLEEEDNVMYQSIVQTKAMSPESVEDLGLDFTYKGVPLVDGGDDKPVTGENLNDYFHELLKHRFFKCACHEIEEIMRGFHKVIPRPLLIPFSPQEIELALYGMPTIDMKDLIDNAEYDTSSAVVKWFWEIVRAYDSEMKARFIQFVTGT